MGEIPPILGDLGEELGERFSKVPFVLRGTRV